MRIALCLSGQPRTWRATRQSLLTYFAGHELDVFIHTWREGDPAELEAVLAAYAPRAHLIEPRPLFAAEKRLLAANFPTRPALTMFDMFHSVAQSLSLAAAEGPDAYDAVVRVRFDAMFDGTWTGEAPGAGELIIPDNYPDPGCCNDQFAIGRPAEMQAYAAVSGYLREILPQIQGKWLRPEIVLRVYLEEERGLKLRLEPVPMRLCRPAQASLPFAALTDDVLFHAEKHESWEAFAREQFPEVAQAADFQHPARAAFELDRALGAWLESCSPHEADQLLRAPWTERIGAVNAFITAQAGGLPVVNDDTYRGVRLICAALLQRMDHSEPMGLEAFLVYSLSANIEDMRRANDWAVAAPDRLQSATQALAGLGALARAHGYAQALHQTGIGAWRAH